MAETLVEMAKRLCNENCNHCKACNQRGRDKCVILVLKKVETASNQIAFLQDWAEQNPVKTYKDVLLEKFSRAEFNPDKLCRETLFGEGEYGCEGVDCTDCWNKPYKEYGGNE